MSYNFPDGNQNNPYQSGPFSGEAPLGSFNQTKVSAPAIALIIFGVLGCLASTWGIINAIIAAPPQIPPDSPEWMQQMMKGSVGPAAIAIQSIFLVVNFVILFGAVQMLRLKTWGLALTASILSIVNIGSCCCFLGLPLGIWALVILLQTDVKAAFMRNA